MLYRGNSILKRLFALGLWVIEFLGASLQSRVTLPLRLTILGADSRLEFTKTQIRESLMLF
jgi:hypothetical protein